VRIAILGVGLIGGSIGLAARERADATVSGYDADPQACAAALELGAIDERAADIAEAVRGAQVVFAATPVGVLARTVREALLHASSDCVVSDVGSTKLALEDARQDRRFIGGHPLAGAETAGVAHARGDLFDGATWYLTPTPPVDGPLTPTPPVDGPFTPTPPMDGSLTDGSRTDGISTDALYERLRDLIERLGADPVAMRPEAHDRLMACVSHLPHALANVLAAQAAAACEREGSPLTAGPSLGDAIRVAGANTSIWIDIYLANRAALLEAIDETARGLGEVRAALLEGDADALAAWNERARAAREALLG
jgi:prephenate dehydrogenase